MKKPILLTLLFLATVTQSYSQQAAKTTDGKTVILNNDGTWFYADSIRQYNTRSLNLTYLEIPKTNPSDVIITHTGYSLLYNETHEQASWVAYDLTKEETNKMYERTDKYIPDPQVSTGTANDYDYSGSGYDRGHLAPAADMGWSSKTMEESFYYSNMSPQLPGFNRGIWKKLEELVRTWAFEYGDVYIVTGPVLTSGLSTIGPDNVSVPKYYYKVILDYSEPDLKGIGFILPNYGSSESLQNFASTIDSVEKVTGIDFFPALPDDQETNIEKTRCISCWSWASVKTGSGSGDENKSSGSVQCSGTTKAGTRCKHMTYSPNGRCYQHGGD
jgi:endonuclease G